MTETYKIGVTGAGGYIGSRLTANLLEEGHEVVPTDNFYNAKVDEVEGVEIRDLDVRDRDGLRETYDDVDVLMHLAAVSGVDSCDDNPELAFDVNVGGTENVAWVCRENGIPLVFPCSMAIIGDPVEFPITSDHPRNPLNTYGLTKSMGEDDIHSLSRGEFPAHVYMKSNLYGHHELGGKEIGKNTVINIFVDKALNKEPLTVFKPGTQARDFIHVKDTARAYADSLDVILDEEDGATTYPIASGDCRSILEIAETVQEVVEEERGYSPEVELVDNPREDETLVDDFTVDTTKARDGIGFEAEYDIERAVREMVSE
ncbi:MAG: NAD-dependent epimerase/dehydratase family protein [Halobacteria archaeon]|nr:NAD-dependent epimerase/dehydratase family protein [Halobacteria archaeon]